MSWAIGYDSHYNREIGYGVPAYCDHPDCDAEIHRGLAYVCGGEPYGGDSGCGLYFCCKHLTLNNPQQYAACDAGQKPFTPKPDHPDWTRHKMTDPSWAEWRTENDL